MSPRRYEISDEQWEQIKDMFPRAKTGRPPALRAKRHILRVMSLKSRFVEPEAEAKQSLYHTKPLLMRVPFMCGMIPLP